MRLLFLLPWICILANAALDTTVPAPCYPKNDPPMQKDLMELKYYYNMNKILHAFAADSAGYNHIQNNGIGYPNLGDSGPIGGTISNEGYTRLHDVCSDPEQRKYIGKMWFTKIGRVYQHIFAESKSPRHVYAGYVSVRAGACGSTIPIRRWGSSMTDDVMYHKYLEWHSWHKGKGGPVVFYLWEMDEAKRNTQRKGTDCPKS